MSAAEVINSPAASCARVDCQRNSSQSGFINKPSSSQTTGARGRVREGGVAIRCREAYFRAWRIAKFGDDIDPVRVAVDEAVAAFSFGKDEAGMESDRSLWLKIANRAGLDAFLDAFDQMTAEFRELGEIGKRLMRPAASFQKLLNKRFPKDPPSPKATEDKGGAA